MVNQIGDNIKNKTIKPYANQPISSHSLNNHSVYAISYSQSYL